MEPANLMTLELEQRIIHLAPCAILIRPMRYMIAIEIIVLVAALIEASRRVSMRHSWCYDHPFVFSPSLNVKMTIILFTWHPGIVRMCVKILWHDPTTYIVVNMKLHRRARVSRRNWLDASAISARKGSRILLSAVNFRSAGRAVNLVDQNSLNAVIENK